MVATRRAARRETAAGGGGPGPGGATETASADIGTSVPTRMSSRSKAVRKADVIQEPQLEELDRAGTKPDVSNSIEMQISGNENTAVHSAQPSADPQADGDVSEAESNCSTVSGLQTPLFIRVTRRRQIVVPYQPGSPAKKRHNRTAFPNKLSRTVDEGDISEAESCSSAVSDAYKPNVSKTTRNRQSKKKLQSDPVCEAQSEDVSDAESCCFHTEPSVTTRQTTRSVQMKLQAENTQRAEKVSRIVSKTENVIKDTIKSESDLISDSSPAAEFNTEVASFVSECNKDPSSPKSKRSLKSANAVSSEDVKQGILNEMTSSSLKKMEGKSTTESPVKKAIADTELVGVDDSEQKSGQMQDEYSEVPREVKLKNMDVCLMDCMSPKLFLESPGEIKPNENNSVPENGRVGAEAAVQRSSTHASELRKGEQSSAVSSSEKEVPAAQTTGSIVRMAGNSVDSGKDQTRERAEFESCSSERSNGENDSFALFLSKDGSDESENSDATDAGTAGKNLSYTEADESSPSRSLENSLHAEGLFVIDTEPGMGSSKKYYLDQVEQGSDVESKHEASEKAEESSDLEEAEEELIDEDEKDEDDDLLKNKIDVSDVNHGNSVKDFLHLSSSIDPGLNIRKLGGLYISFDGKKQKPSSSVMNQLKEKKKDQLLQKSIITPDFERKECVPPFRESLQQLKKQRRAEREKTTGDGWFGMKAPEITSELKNDLKVLKMRASLDPKHFYKKNDRDGLPKYFQVGTVVDSPIDFYHSRIPKKQRKKTIVEELLADSEFRRYNKRKYQEIMSEKAAYAAGKRNRKKKKFHN